MPIKHGIPSQEYIDLMLEFETDKQIAHTISNQPELYQFFMDNLVVLESLSQIIAMNYKHPQKMGCLLIQQLDQDLKEIIAEDVRRNYE